MNFVRTLLLCAVAVLTAIKAPSQEIEPGLKLTFENESGTSSVVAPNVSLYVDNGSTPNPFLSEGRFRATWTGFVTAELRGIYSFQARLNGALSVTINGKEVLSTSGNGDLTDVGDRVRLLKGTNSIVAKYSSPENGDASLRLFWVPRRSFSQPIPAKAFSHQPDDPLIRSQLLHHGRELMLEHRCFHCHEAEHFTVPEREMDAPTFTGIGSRRNSDWMADWIENPKSLRTNAQMPELLHGPSAEDDAMAIAAYLSTLNQTDLPPDTPKTDGASAAHGQQLFSTLHCVTCHESSDTGVVDGSGIGLDNVATKFTTQSLAEFLKHPGEHYRWIRMPNFGLDEVESQSLALYLADEQAPIVELSNDTHSVDRGRSLVQTKGCMNCHSGPDPNQFSAKPVNEIEDWTAGCLSESASRGTPYYSFTAGDRLAIRAFASVGFDSLSRHVDTEFATRQIANHNCIACHDHQIDGVPSMHLLGTKLKPEYAVKLIAGMAEHKPRPWLDQRMPGFNESVAAGIANGLANLNGFPSRTPPPESRDQKIASTGRKLVSPVGGFSCVSCHAIGYSVEQPIFESPGINFASTFERLQPEYFHFWMLNPLRVDPTTKMPVYFDEEKRSPLFEIYDGDADKQIEALWVFLSAGGEMELPEGMPKPVSDAQTDFE